MNTNALLRTGATLLSLLAPAAMAAVWTVNTTADTPAAAFPGNPGELRWAINMANNDPGPDPGNPVRIDFAIPAGQLVPPAPGGVATIQVLRPLPILSNVNGLRITMDGFTQSPTATAGPAPPASIVCEVVLDGSLIATPYVAGPGEPPFAHGLYIMSSRNRIYGLCVQNFPHDGISIQGIPPGFNGHTLGANQNEIYWNLVGTDVTGFVAMPNGHGGGGLWGGIYVKVLPGHPGLANNNHILENLSSGNTFEGVGIANCPDEGSQVRANHVERCYIGTDITGAVTPPNLMGNGADGVYIGEGAVFNVVDQNTICHNGQSGVGIVGFTDGQVQLFTNHNTVINNRIGVDVNLNPLGNVRHGVAIGSYNGGVWGFAQHNLIETNTIAHNGLAGVALDDDAVDPDDQDTSFNQVTRNAIYLNGMADPGHLGIDLMYEPTLPRPPGGVTPNDPGDGDQGPNDLINFPVITSAVYNAGTTTVSGTIDIAGAANNVEVFRALLGNYSNHGQGATYLGSDTAPGATSWTVVLTGGALPGQLLTATVTDSFGTSITAGSTSEFAENVPVWDENQEPLDWGDAPDDGQAGLGTGDYQTLSVSGGPQHVIVPGMYLGASVDGEPDGQPDPSATGDDILDGNDDEDGVVVVGTLTPGLNGQINVTASMLGRLDCWIDFNADGDWTDANEQILSSAIHAGGGATLPYAFTVPASAVNGTTFLRIRYSPGGGLLPTGPGTNPPDGEVEDHQVTIGDQQPEEFDWGDAPDLMAGTAPGDYQTRTADNGAFHPVIAQAPYFDDGSGGDSPDLEADGQPDPNALGDDSDGNDDEDGVVIPNPLMVGVSTTINFSLSAPGWVDAFIDWNGDGDWTDAGENVFSGSMPGGPNSINVTAPGPYAGQTFARFRVHTDDGAALPPTGGAPDGEVEDHEVLIEEEEPQEHDWGDAPDVAGTPQYPTLSGNSGAHHLIVPGGPILGNVIDSDPDGQPTIYANGDDIVDGGDDEDGVFFPHSIVAGVPTKIQVSSATGGTLQGWIDWNGDGDWADAGEQVVTDLGIPAGPTTLSISVPSAAMGGPNGRTYARFRISSLGGIGVGGYVADGEVEDYLIHLEPLKWLQIPEQGQEGVDVSNVQFMLADDFECTSSGEITNIHFWGSFLGDVLPEEGPGGLIFDISIWSDVPAGVDAPYSHPGVKLWEKTFHPGQYSAGQIWYVQEGEWWHEPGSGVWTPGADHGIYQFDFYPPAGEAFLQEGEPQAPVVYWLAVKYRYEGTSSFQFGWKTTPEPWNDDACYFDPNNPSIFWTDLVYEPPHPWSDPQLEMTSVNLAFALSGGSDLESDWGDAPDPGYPTLMASTGAAHSIDALFMGVWIDAEPDGQPHTNAIGDDTDAGGNDDDGVVFITPLVGGLSGDVQALPSAPGVLDAWIDADADGTWNQPNEQIITGLAVNPGDGPITMNLPAVSTPLTTFLRFRLTHGGAGPTGFAAGGEVEDYEVAVGKPIRAGISMNRAVTPHQVVLTWTAEPGATQYSIYSSTTLSGWTEQVSGLPGMTWSENMVPPRKFYIVVAFP